MLELEDLLDDDALDLSDDDEDAPAPAPAPSAPAPVPKLSGFDEAAASNWNAEDLESCSSSGEESPRPSKSEKTSVAKSSPIETAPPPVPPPKLRLSHAAASSQSTVPVTAAAPAKALPSGGLLDLPGPSSTKLRPAPLASVAAASGRRGAGSSGVCGSPAGVVSPRPLPTR